MGPTSSQSLSASLSDSSAPSATVPVAAPDSESRELRPQDDVASVAWAEPWSLGGGAAVAAPVTWSTQNQHPAWYVSFHELVTGLALYEDDLHALSCSRDRSFLCWELRNEKRMTSHTQRMGGINSIALSKDQTNVFTVGQEKRLTRWDLRDQNFLEAVDLSDDQSDEASCVAVSNSGLVVATGGTKKLLKLYETAPGHKLLASVVGHSGAIRDLKFSPDDKQLVTVGEDGVIFVWNLYVD